MSKHSQFTISSVLAFAVILMVSGVILISQLQLLVLGWIVVGIGIIISAYSIWKG